MEHATPAIILLFALFVGPVLVFIARARNGQSIYIRRIPGIDAIDDAIGRSVELGRPIAFTSGLTGVSAVLYACLGVLRHIGTKAAIYGARIFVPCNDPEALVLTETTLQSAYRSARKFSSYDPTSLRYLSEDQFAFASGYMGLIHRENVGSAFLFGRYAAESLILAEAGQQIGAVQVAATVSPEQVPFFITACDYTLIGEELFAAGAFLSADPVQVGSLRGQDIAKCFVLLLIVLGVAQSTYFAITTGVPVVPFTQYFSMSWSELIS